MLLCHLSYHRLILVKLYERNYEDAPKFDLSRHAFQGQSRSLEPTRIDRLPMTSYYTTLFHQLNGSIKIYKKSTLINITQQKKKEISVQ